MNEVLQGEPPAVGCGPVLMAGLDQPEQATFDHAAGEARIEVLTASLHASEWEMVRAFVGRVSREDLRLRFGRAVNLRDEATLKRLFDITDATGEMLWALDERGEISGILHRVLTAPREAEIGLVVRSDRQRQGIGRTLIRAALARAGKQNLQTLRASVLRENLPMLRLAKAMGLALKKSAGLSVELEFDFAGEPDRHRGQMPLAA
jgi:RimJ/RimL family protein N-acetyltransferase